MGDIRFAICPVVRERKTEVAGERRHGRGGAAGGRGATDGEGRMAERTDRYRSAAIDFARMQLHMQPSRIYIPLGQVVLSGSRERANAAIN